MALVCDVQYDGDQTTFQPGQIISGRVIVTLNERLLFKALSLRVAGYTIVRWEKPPKKKKQKYNKGQVEEVQVVTTNEPNRIYTYREDYISILNYYIGSEEASERIVERGIYTYPFMVRLPDQCPSTFETALGYVRYEFQICIDYARTQHVCYDRVLPVYNPIDLRVDRRLMQPLEIEFLEKKNCLKFWQHALHLTINIPQQGYVPGENISIHAKILNNGKLQLRDIIYKLNLIGTYTGEYKNKKKVKMLRTALVEKQHSLVTRSETSLQHLDLLMIPQTPTNTTENQCKCLQIDYEVEVIVTTFKHKRFVSGRLPIKIGTISLRSELREMSDAFGSIPYVQPSYSVENLGGAYVGAASQSYSMNALDTIVVTEEIKKEYPTKPDINEKNLHVKPNDINEEKKKSPVISKGEMAGVSNAGFSHDDEKPYTMTKAEMAGVSNSTYSRNDEKSSTMTKSEKAGVSNATYSYNDEKPTSMTKDSASNYAYSHDVEESISSCSSSVDFEEASESGFGELRINNDYVNEKYQMVYSDVQINTYSKSYDYPEKNDEKKK